MLVGREREKRRLLRTLDADGPLLVFVHGIAGIGKSTLLAAFAQEARSLGATVVMVDCRAIEPTERGFLHSLAAATGCGAPTVEAIVEKLEETPGTVVLVLDTYEVFRFFDWWLRERFVPDMPGNVRIVLSGREQPVAAWLTAPEWRGSFESLHLEALAEIDAHEMLERGGLSVDAATRVNRFTHGHPLALTLAVATHAERPHLELAGEAMPGVLAKLVGYFLADVKDPGTRLALEAAAVVRRLTHSLLTAMLPDAMPQDVMDRLQTLPFVVSDKDGLILHDAIRDAIAVLLKAQHPSRHQQLRRRAWLQLRREASNVGLDELWRYTADLLYIIENPFIREAFFPSNAPQYLVQSARPVDRDAVFAITRRHEPDEVASAIEAWWHRMPSAFHVALDYEGRVAGFHIAFEPDRADRTWLEDDPLTREWCAHLQQNPVPARQKVLFLRRWLTEETGELPGGAQAACWLDIKRTYMYLRPHLRRIYTCVTEPGLNAFRDVVLKLGFVPFAETIAGGETFYSATNDFGPESVDGWLAGLIAAELGITPTGLLDREARELVLESGRVGLTRLEYALMAYLEDRRGRAVSRADLLNDVWGYSYEGGSNVVEAVVRSLRKKLGGEAAVLETVVGVGYRLRAV
jgi:hypothetical protein